MTIDLDGKRWIEGGKMKKKIMGKNKIVMFFFFYIFKKIVIFGKFLQIKYFYLLKIG